MVKWFRLGFLMCLAILSFGLHADNNDDIQQLIKQLESFNNFQADFKQTTLDEKESVVQQLSGSVVLQKPSQFYWQSDEPFAQQLISDGNNIWHFDEDLEQVIIQQYQSRIQQAPILLILENPKNLTSNFELLSYSSVAGVDQFSLKPLDKGVALTNIALHFKDSTLVRLVFIDSVQQKTSVDFMSAEVDSPIDKKQFTFTVPEGADVLYE